MGCFLSKTYAYIENEQNTWSGEHKLEFIEFNESIQSNNLRLLDNFKDGCDIYLSFVNSSYGGIKYQHWFVTDGEHYLEFGSASQDIYTAHVSINTNPRDRYVFDPRDSKNSKKMDKHVRERMRQVLGMCNYSLCMRNCEHVANYVFHGYWFSKQMVYDEPYSLMEYFTGCLMSKKLIQHFPKDMLGKYISKLNTFPAFLGPQMFDRDKTKKLYTFIEDHYEFDKIEYYLDYEEDTYNVLFVGPTGAGKSHLINVLFNQQICKSQQTYGNVTQDIYFVRGRGKVYNTAQKSYEECKIVMADTIGLCKTEWNDSKVISLIKNRVSSNFKYIDAVYVVFNANRLSEEHIKSIKKILRLLRDIGGNRLGFMFVGTHAESLPPDNKSTLSKKTQEIFQFKMESSKTYTKECTESMEFTGFPPEEALNEQSKKEVEESWRKVQAHLKRQPKTDRISTRPMSSCTIL